MPTKCCGARTTSTTDSSIVSSLEAFGRAHRKVVRRYWRETASNAEIRDAIQRHRDTIRDARKSIDFLNGILDDRATA
jgi:hypothetical protein